MNDRDLDLDVFFDARFSEPRTGGIGEILILGRSRRSAAATTSQLAESEGRVKPTQVQLAAGSRIEFETAEEAERFLAAIANVCEDFDVESRREGASPAG